MKRPKGWRTKPAVIGVVGSRRRNKIQDHDQLKDFLSAIMIEGDKFVSGGCSRGADHFIEDLAKGNGFTITIHYPDWRRHGKAAGFVRNQLIADDCDFLIALPAKDRTGGTEDTIRKAKKLNKPVILLGVEDDET